MDSNDLASFLADPVTFLGDWPLQIGVPSGTKGTTSTAAVASSSEAVEFVQYPAASNRVTFYLHKDTPSESCWINTTQASAQAQTKTGYRLPWNGHKAYYIQLDDQADLFATARLNGCCVMVSGAGNDVQIAHVNRGDDAIEEAVRGVQDQDVANAKRLKLFDAFYWDVMGRLITLGALSDTTKVTLFDPGSYSGGNNRGLARVYGIRRSTGWTFYACIETKGERRTSLGPRPICVNKQIWP
jgi:hypothetical protein